MIIIKMENGKEIKIELDYENAPNTATNFACLASKGFYNGLIFHRVIKNFMIQGGDPTGTGSGGPGYCIKGEFKSNGFNNKISHLRGVISMARTMEPNSAGSQFFIVQKDAPHLDGQYAAFGKVVEGIEVVDEIASVQTNAVDRPRIEQKILTVSVHNEVIKEPKKI
ncbi:MAG: peptidylprolyl isomerase [Bacilli bacterium]|nr:peptidylprolyl isomerase [Bacilli bacterium]